MNKKLIKKCLPGDIIVKSDNTRVQMPRTDVEPIKIPDEELKWMGWREETLFNGEKVMRPPLATGALTPVYPEFDLLTLGRSLYTMPKWRPFLPKGTPSTVYRQGGYTMLDDALETGLVRPKPKNKYLDVITKDFNENVMFNKIYPFYGSTPEIYPVAFVGNTNKTSAIWKHLRHKGHKNIFEPYMNGSKQAPLSEFRIFTSAPFKFGWYETPLKNSFHLPVFGLSPLFNEDLKYE